MDTRRKIGVKYRVAHAPFIETYRDVVPEEQPLGAPLEREIIVVRIDKSCLYSFLLAIVVLTIIVGIFFGES